MRKFKNQILTTIFGLALTVLIGCQKENKFEFGVLQTGFKADTVYKAASDGLLTVQWYSANFLTESGLVYIYSDNNPKPTTIIGRITWPSTSTVPINKDNYWKVSRMDSLKIEWTAIINSN